ncbi:MAG TPA: carbohydrate porin [Candidatus Baltobacteraceae bacterium]|nr:carbohydrate porin [Candidatus Baltobacteraceae bacterium]
MFFAVLLTTIGAAIPAVPIPTPKTTPTPAPARWSVHWQATNTQQYHGAFPAAYSGANSLSNMPDTQKTFSSTIYLGYRLWKGAEAFYNEDIDQGFGFGSTLGLAGFSSGEAYKVGASRPYERAHQYFITQTFNEGGGTQSVDSGQNVIAGSQDVRNITLTGGKFSVVNIFDNNVYAHDPRNDFLNWSVVDMGAFDYAADAWGYTYGLAASINRAQSAFTVGLFQLSKTPNTTVIERVPFLQYSPVLEYDRNMSLFGGHPGKFRFLTYGDYGYMAPLADTISYAAASGTTPNPLLFRQNRHWKIGEGVNIEQELAPHVGAFLRLSADNGSYEAFDFTEIDRSAELGLSVDGTPWHRPNDTVGIAAVQNSISAVRQQYLADGGLGILIGDGGLSYGPESVLETYYRFMIFKGFSLKGDYQRVVNPAYNTVRGPVSIYTLQFHYQI